jgi:hypothetical protein
MNSEVVNYSKAKLKRIIAPFTLLTTKLEHLDSFETHLKDSLTKEFGDLILPEKIFFKILKVKGDCSDCALEVSIDKYSFSLEDRIHKNIYQSVVEYT